MPQLKALEITTNEDAEKVHEFALENSMYLAESLADVAGSVKEGNIGRAVARFSVHMLEAYVSGLNDGIERANRESQ